MFYEEEYNKVKNWLSEFQEKILFCSGALGDFFLGIDLAMKNNVPIIYWSKKETYDISLKFLEAFDIKNHVINVGKEIWRNGQTLEFCNALSELLENRGFKTHGNNKCRLPVIDFMSNTVNNQYNQFKDFKINLPEKYCLLCPSGGTNFHKIRRCFYLPEFNKIITMIKNNGVEPILTGSEPQLSRYDQNKKFKWLQFEKFQDEEITIKHFIEAVRSAEYVVSPDTSIKTLSGAMNIPTYVLKNRNEKGDFINGPWDRVFLNRSKWKTIECFTLNSLYDKINLLYSLKML